MPNWGHSHFIVEEQAVSKHERREHALPSESRDRPAGFGCFTRPTLYCHGDLFPVCHILHSLLSL